ncbi:Cyclopropane-fatty-acyl-phospholipid synthase [Rhodobacteraceae bacterium THAF1]|uniref:SAM-dependent methyltransferase n=1 Tax=Palleronia sp. THAF1 TaxID=2587842 RepID=UPI000F3B668A|nr:cyclopropane-fatty-acyl-phospholipid synthase family protein [Palleronia sp. THAF1]QFU07358.1 Cyclopropane-fatty-acyl-phospholipid synthase [Palleronia sp. THAF1]VDC20730.1 Cyclopropane-fatty-acyl-phospholipid synthase [Rhodobacteraceae bacterium THAF1]
MWERIFVDIVHAIVRDGTLHVTLPSSRKFSAGSGEPQITAAITETDRLAKIVKDPDLGTGEGYMEGELVIENDDLRGFMGLLLGNMRSGHQHWIQRAHVNVGKHLRRVSQFNPARKSRENVAHHYDLSAELYDIFLDADRQYSCAYWPTDEITLEEAQLEKKRHIARKLLIEPGMTVLDIGCGWGGMAITLAEEFGAHVVGVTLSEEQYSLANKRVTEKGLQDKVEIRLQDYRDVTETFDRVVSVGMFEHVGVPHYDEYFAAVRERMTGDGIALIHTIGRMNPPGITSAFIEKYIFPGGYIPALSETVAAVERQRLDQMDIEVWRLHYAKTLRAWQLRFEDGIDKVHALYDERFARMWRYYLVASEMSFVYGQQVVFHLQLAKQKDSVPITRDYLYS